MYAERVVEPAVACEAQGDDVDDETDDGPGCSIVRRVVAANDCPAPETRGAPSVFHLAERLPTLARILGAGFGPRGKHQGARFYETSRIDGTTRCVGAQYPRDRWTEEREELERQRRARQKPPKPVKAARTRSKKLLSLIGDSS